jgi:hypothetical protein
MGLAQRGHSGSTHPQRRALFRRRGAPPDAAARGSAWSEAAVDRVVPNLLDVRDGIMTLGVAGEAEICGLLLHRIGRMIGRPFDARHPLSLPDLDAEQPEAAEALPAAFERLFEARPAPDPTRPVLLFFAALPEQVTAPAVSEVLVRFAGAFGLLVLPQPTTAETREAVLDCLSGSAWLPIFVAATAADGAGTATVLETEQLARTIHEMFLENAWTRGERLGSTPALRPWRSLDDAYKAPNRAQAEHISFKLAAVGLMVSPTPTIADGNAEPVWSRPELIESLALMEHDRWASERILAGWTQGEIRDERTRRHPDLRPYEELSQEAREKDRVAVATIPFILHTGGFGWSPLITVPLAPDWPDPTAHLGWRHRWRRDAARVAEERAPAVLELLADPQRPHHLDVGLVANRVGFPISLRVNDPAAISVLLGDEAAGQPLLECLALCRRVVWPQSPNRAAAPGVARLTAVASRGNGLRVERPESGS